MKILEILKTKSNIQVCKNCEGSGEVPDMSWGSGVTDRRLCRICEGKGRIRTFEAKVEIDLPFDFKV